MIHRLFFHAIALILTIHLTAQDRIDFQDADWPELLKKSAKEDKLIFLEGYVTWSEPCAIIDEYSFSDKEVATFYNEKFINVQMDMEDFPGVELADEYDIDSYPALLFIDGKGKVIHRACGALKANELIELGQQALGDNHLSAMKMAFDSGERSLDFLVDYSIALENACLDKSDFVNTFFKDLDQREWVTEPAWTMINLNVSDPYSDQFQYLMAYHDMFSLKYGKDTVDKKVYNVLLDQLIEIYEGNDLTLFATQALRSLIREVDFNDNNELLALANLKAADLKQDWPAYAENVVNVVKEQEVSDPDQLNEFAWKFYLFVEETSHLEAARDWMKDVLKDYPVATFYDTLASLLYKLGDQKEAIKYSKKALQAAELEGEDLMHYKQQLGKFEASK